ncbi:MAG: hypothetical protein NWF00_11610 [Candidatus Bathyarchaeota archaeon]|nr:hypothetical protein [Candidatus Bathyarchaeota archaeon]
MGRKSASDSKETNMVERAVVSDYVKLCFDKGITPEEAFNEIKRKLTTEKMLEIQVAPI